VAVTGRSQRELLAALRKAGEAPLAEEPDGSPRPESARPVRHVPRAAPDRLGPAVAVPNGHAGPRPELDPATAVARLRGRRPAASGLDPVDEPARGGDDRLSAPDPRAAHG
jgi:hypothetical protein